MESPSIYERLVAIGVSKPYASQIANGYRKPSLHLALKIFRETGLKLGPLFGASEDDIASAIRLSTPTPKEAA